MEKTLCHKCFHYNACMTIDLSGTVGNPECENQPCEHYIDSELIKIQEKANWILKVSQYSDANVFVEYRCSHCNNMKTIKHYGGKEWDEYYSEHYRDNENTKLPNFCEVCGSEVNGVVKDSDD